MEYIFKAFEDVNRINAKRILLYLAKNGDRECSRKQIMEDPQLDLTDQELEKRLTMLRMADLISWGSSFYHYKGLGDPVFEMVFRKHYGPEIEALEPAEIDKDLDRAMIKLKKQQAWFKCISCE